MYVHYAVYINNHCTVKCVVHCAIHCAVHCSIMYCTLNYAVVQSVGGLGELHQSVGVLGVR